jgi:hypothetical protein
MEENTDNYWFFSGELLFGREQFLAQRGSSGAFSFRDQQSNVMIQGDRGSSRRHGFPFVRGSKLGLRQ